MGGSRLLAAAAALLLAGCTLGPDFQRPEADTPPAWSEGEGSGGEGLSAAPPDPRWWAGFNDPLLTSLVERAIDGNLDLQRAVLRIVEARAEVRQAQAAGLPSLRATGSAVHEQLGLEGPLGETGLAQQLRSGKNGSQTLEAATAPVDLFTLGFDASWELDLFGRVRRSVEQAEAAQAAEVEGRNDALVSLAAEVVETYARLRAAQVLTATTEQEIGSARRILDLTRRRRRQGLVSELDVDQASTQLSNQQALLPQFEQQAEQAGNALSVLLGQPPGSLRDVLSAPGAIPPPPPRVPVGLPAGLARRRPDIRQAEARLHAATAVVGEAIAALYPDISLTGTFGTRALQVKYLNRWANSFYSAGGNVSLPIFQGGRLVAGLTLARAEQADAVLAYRGTVLKALRDVENALVAYRTDQQRERQLRQSVVTARDALDLAENRYDHGLSSFIDVLNGETAETQARQQWTQAVLAVTTDLVGLYKALGGGWQDGAPGGGDGEADLPIGTPGNGGMAGGPEGAREEGTQE